MSFALFHSTLRSAVREAQDAPSPGAAPPTQPLPVPQAELLRRVARGEVSVDEALEALGDRR